MLAWVTQHMWTSYRLWVATWGGWRYLGVRCAQGHGIKGVHEARFGVRFTPALAAKVPCIRHARLLGRRPRRSWNVGFCRGGGGGGGPNKRSQVHFPIAR